MFAHPPARFYDAESRTCGRLAAVGGGRAAGAAVDHGYWAILGSRARLHLVYRLAARLLQVVAADGGAYHSGRWQLLLVGFVGVDIGLWALLRNPRRFWLKSRVLIDAIDIATWSLAPYPPGMAYDTAVFVGFPLAMEAGFRLQWLGLVVPGVTLGVTSAVRLAAGRPVLPFVFLWLVLAVVTGMLLRRYDARLRRQVHDDWARQRAAEDERAYLGGQHAVAMGASSTVDALEAVVPVLGPPQAGSALFELANAWKARLGTAASRRAVYLGMALQQWAAGHNQHPDLSSHVRLTLPEGEGTLLLTGSQPRALQRLLTAADLRGEVKICLDDSRLAQRPPGGPVRLRVGSGVVDVPADRRRSPSPCDPAPLAFVLAAIAMARGVLAIGEHVPVLPTALCIAAAIGAARWSHRRLRRLGLAARPGIVWMAVGLGALHITLASLTMQHFFNPAGMTNYPGMGSFLMLALIGGMYFHSATRLVRFVTLAGAVLLAGLSWFAHQAPQHWLHLLVTLLFPLSLFVTGLRLGRELDAAEREYDRELRAGDEAAAAHAFEDGRRSVVGLAVRAYDEAQAQLTSIAGKMDPADFDVVTSRLKEVDRRLRILTGSVESPSLTITT